MESLRVRSFAVLTIAAVLSLAGCSGTGQNEPAADAVDPTLATLAEIQAMFDSGELTSEELVRQSLDRIEAYDTQGPALNAMINLNDRSLEETRAV